MPRLKIEKIFNSETFHRITNKISRSQILFVLFAILCIIVYLAYDVSFILLRSKEAFYELSVDKNSFELKGRGIISSEKWIVVTSINSPTKEIKFLSKINSFHLLVVGDISSPNNWSYPNVTFLSIQKQKQLYPKLAKVIPEKCYCRKIFGYLYAIEHGAKFIYDTDDDNAPLININQHFNYENESHGLVINVSNHNTHYNVINPYAHFGQSGIWPRGYPLNRIKFKNNVTYTLIKRKTSIVQQGLVNGDPDVDAIYRLIYSNEKKKRFDIKFDSSAPSIQLIPDVYSPYNSQNTLFLYDAFWSLYLPHSVAFRITDIWRSYWAQRLMWLIDGTLEFHGPTAYQLRNPHSYLKDFAEEDDLYKKTDDLIKFLNEWSCDDEKSFKECIIHLSFAMSELKFWSVSDAKSIEVWLSQLEIFSYKFPVRKNITENVNKTGIDVVFSPKISQYDELQSLIIQNMKSKPVVQYLQNDFFINKCSNVSNSTSSNFSIHEMISKYSKKVKESKLANLTLLVTFNREVRRENIDYIFAMYYDYFQNLLFCGKNVTVKLREVLNSSNLIYKHLNGIDMDLTAGYFHYDCMNKALEMNFRTEGILLISDDVLIKPWNLAKLDTNKLWYFNVPCENRRCFMAFNETFKTNWIWWGSDMGYAAVKNMFQVFEKASKKSNLFQAYSRFKNNFEINTNSSFSKNKIEVLVAGSDIFYLPKRLFSDFHELAVTARTSRVFLEIAVPTLIYGLDKRKNIINMNGSYNWGGQFSYENHYNSMQHFYHPAKLSYVEKDLKTRRLFCQMFVNDKYLN